MRVRLRSGARASRFLSTRRARCKYMFPALALGGCRFVRGVIKGSGSCKEFKPRHPTGS